MTGYRFDLHIHSTGSHDSSLSPGMAITRARELGLSGLAFTDHDVLTRHGSPFPDFVLVPAAEITTDWGDLLAIGITEMPRAGLGVWDLLDIIHAQGAAVVIPHPFSETFPTAMNDRVFEIIDAVDGLEVTSPKMSVDNPKARREARMRGKSMTGGSDAHSPEMMGFGATVCDCPDVDGLVRALQNGQTDGILLKSSKMR